MYNALKNNEPSFCRNLNVSRTCHSIYKNNEAVLNSSVYYFWAYKITTSTKPTCQVLLMLGNALCDTLNSISLNLNTVRVEKDNLFWLTQCNCVWADIVGHNKDKEYLLEKLGNTSNTPNLYDQNKDLIHSQLLSKYITIGIESDIVSANGSITPNVSHADSATLDG